MGFQQHRDERQTGKENKQVLPMHTECSLEPHTAQAMPSWHLGQSCQLLHTFFLYPQNPLKDAAQGMSAHTELWEEMLAVWEQAGSRVALRSGVHSLWQGQTVCPSCFRLIEAHLVRPDWECLPLKSNLPALPAQPHPYLLALLGMKKGEVQEAGLHWRVG